MNLSKGKNLEFVAFSPIFYLFFAILLPSQFSMHHNLQRLSFQQIWIGIQMIDFIHSQCNAHIIFRFVEISEFNPFNLWNSIWLRSDLAISHHFWIKMQFSSIFIFSVDFIDICESLNAKLIRIHVLNGLIAFSLHFRYSMELLFSTFMGHLVYPSRTRLHWHITVLLAWRGVSMAYRCVARLPVIVMGYISWIIW